MIENNRIFCIGRNYVEHIVELKNEIPDEMVVFSKYTNCLLESESVIKIPDFDNDLHYEGELVVKLLNGGKNIIKEIALNYVESFTLGFDLTLRNLQNKLKSKGLPWEKAKSFEGSAPIGDWIPYKGQVNLNEFQFEVLINNEVKQKADTSLMIYSVSEIISQLSRIWTLQPGDIIFTGTPKGVGLLKSGDVISLKSNYTSTYKWNVL